MRCHACDVAVGDGQRFCHECGTSLHGVTDATAQHDAIVANDLADDVETAVDPNATVDLSPASDASVPPPTILPAVLFDPSATPDTDTDTDTGPAAPPENHPDSAWWAPTPGDESTASTDDLPTQPVATVVASTAQPLSDPEPVSAPLAELVNDRASESSNDPNTAATAVADDSAWQTPTTAPAPNPLDAVPWATDEPDVSGAEPLVTSMNDVYTPPLTPPQPAPAVAASAAA
ncbi:MAG: hypothetical protein AB8G26_01120, partial [Ilumatobacter sp.]